MNIQNWERAWAPYDEETYQAVLDWIKAKDVVLDIGAGDLRLALRLAAKADCVYAIELVANRLPFAVSLPDNLFVIQQDAVTISFPAGITTAVLLMRHCTHFQLYADKLKAGGCRWLITNARWGFGVERLDLQAPRRPFSDVSFGWYACWCGTIGFVPGQPERLVPELEQITHEVSNCPACVGII